MATQLQVLPEAPVWVLEDDGVRAPGPAGAIAGRLGVPFRRIGAAGAGDRVRAGSGPSLVLSSGTRSGASALLLRARHGCRIVHCARTRPPLPSRLAGYPFDLMVLPSSEERRGAGRTAAATRDDRLLPVLGPPHVVSPALLRRARDLWEERLSHLPTPRITVLLGGEAPHLRAVVSLARRLAQMARQQHGCILVSALAECQPAVADAFAAGLSSCLHLLYRHGEPGENPTLGFVGGADAIVTAWAGAQALSEACAGTAPVYLVSAAPGLGGRATARLIERLVALDQVRPLQAHLLAEGRQDGSETLGLPSWPRTPLDEAGRIAGIILKRFFVRSGAGSA